jgi:hypothetical protein
MTLARSRRPAAALAAGAALLLLAACGRPPEGPAGEGGAPPPPQVQSPPMQSAIPPMSVIAQACAGDIDRLCAGVPPGEGRIRMCMRAHITELSAPCFDTLAQIVASPREP